MRDLNLSFACKVAVETFEKSLLASWHWCSITPTRGEGHWIFDDEILGQSPFCRGVLHSTIHFRLCLCITTVHL